MHCNFTLDHAAPCSPGPAVPLLESALTGRLMPVGACREFRTNWWFRSLHVLSKLAWKSLAVIHPWFT